VHSNENWRLREAATMAFGSILDGPSSQSLRQMVTGALPYLVQGLQDVHPLVKDTSAWTLGKVFEIHWQCVTLDSYPPVVQVGRQADARPGPGALACWWTDADCCLCLLAWQALLTALDDPAPTVANKACFALYNIAADRVGETFPSVNPMTNYLSQFFPHIVQKLLSITERSDVGECNLRAAAYEAVNMLISNSAPDCLTLIGQSVSSLGLCMLVCFLVADSW
jgi:importin subunit beta-1